MDKRIPMRTCTGCREVKPKRELIRIVRQTDEETGADRLIPDEGKTLIGRGAYLCRNMECYDRAVRRGGFNRAFRTSVTKEELDRLKSLLESMEEISEQR